MCLAPCWPWGMEGPTFKEISKLVVAGGRLRVPTSKGRVGGVTLPRVSLAQPPGGQSQMTRTVSEALGP